MAERGHRQHLPKPLRIIAARPRLFLSLLIGALVAVLLEIALPDFDWVSQDAFLARLTRGLLGWDVAVGLYLGLTLWMVAHSGVARIRREAVIQDEGALLILLLTITTTVVSFAAVFVWLEFATRSETLAPFGLCFLFLSIMLSWAFIHTIFALHYAHEFYGEHNDAGRGLRFPGESKPDYWDFLYFSFGIGTSMAVSDVGITSRSIRKTVLVHGIVSFFFNVTLIAMTVGLASDAIQN